LDLFRRFELFSSEPVQYFQVSITYLIAVSLIFSSLLQHSFTRYVSDRLFEKKLDFIVPNLNGALLLLTVCSGILGFLLSTWLFAAQGPYYQFLMSTTFVVLCNIWFTTLLLSGLKNYRAIFAIFVLGYGISILCCYLLGIYGLNGLLAGFFIGQFILLVGMLFTLYYT
jgi:uncharacterized membrane protein